MLILKFTVFFWFKMRITRQLVKNAKLSRTGEDTFWRYYPQMHVDQIFLAMKLLVPHARLMLEFYERARLHSKVNKFDLRKLMFTLLFNNISLQGNLMKLIHQYWWFQKEFLFFAKSVEGLPNNSLFFNQCIENFLIPTLLDQPDRASDWIIKCAKNTYSKGIHMFIEQIIHNCVTIELDPRVLYECIRNTVDLDIVSKLLKYGFSHCHPVKCDVCLKNWVVECEHMGTPLMHAVQHEYLFEYLPLLVSYSSNSDLMNVKMFIQQQQLFYPDKKYPEL